MSRALIVTRQRARLGSGRARILVFVGSCKCLRHQPLVSASVPRAFPKEPVRRRRVVYARTVIGLINHITSSFENPRFVAWQIFLKSSWWSSIFQRALRRSTAKFQPDHHPGRSTARWKLGCASKFVCGDTRGYRRFILNDDDGQPAHFSEASEQRHHLRRHQSAAGRFYCCSASSGSATSRHPGGRQRKSTSVYSASSGPPAVPDARSISLVLLKNCSGHLC